MQHNFELKWPCFLVRQYDFSMTKKTGIVKRNISLHSQIRLSNLQDLNLSDEFAEFYRNL